MVKIGRQTNARTIPAENNGFFESKVFGRRHAEFWEVNQKVRCYFSFLSYYSSFGRRSSSRTSRAPTGHSSTVNDSVQRARERAVRTQVDDIVVRTPIHLVCDFGTISHLIWFRNSALTSSAKTTKLSTSTKLQPASSAYSQNKTP